jgi:superfamily II DNA or RNA helicase
MGDVQGREQLVSETVFIKKVSESTCFVDCSQGAAKELEEHLSFLVPGYKFMPKFKAKLWDGKIRLYSEWSPNLSTGLVPRAASFFAKQGYEVRMTSEVIESFLDHSYSEDELADWIDAQDLRDELGDPIDPYDHQRIAVHLLVKHKRVTLLSPTSSGKSLIIYLVSRWRLLHDDRKVLVIVPTTQLVEQMSRDMLAYSDADPIPGGVHKIYAGHGKDTDSRIVVSTWQSIFRMPASWFKQFGTLFLDEGHGAKAKSIQQVMDACSAVGHRYALTGTLDGAEAHQFMIESAFGPVKRFTSTNELMEKGIVAQLHIKNTVFNYGEEETERFWSVSKGDYHSELKFIWKLKQRNDRIARLVSRLKGNVLVLFLNKKHGDEIFPVIEAECRSAGKTHIYKKTGDDALETRIEVSNLLETIDDGVFVATYGILSTGVSIKQIDHVVLAAPVKSKIRLLQSIGRGLRVSKTKKEVTLWDIIDNFSKTTPKTMKMNHAMKHFFERAKIYDAEKFDSKILEINLEEQ